ncbi:UL148B [Human betaherpesvirus 5]|uniref:Protein UL148B n=2 Tax=Human cytomegalovirus TaxID=10359 RepID=A0A0G2U7R1_HCMV|nr:protein UL148B [Human betaherpesvirus 5]AKI08684.1 protein UL148B [Human betaherpesvirus 5]AKI10366.1 protein UL148B [Human betaherpesvirus 5]AKI18045.1 protein UL148B [Human betaherpesvirus 5]AKI19385.1 protein UL148B [Human betaherpesvirus 5]
MALDTLAGLAICVGLIMGVTVIASCALLVFYYCDERGDGRPSKLLQRSIRRWRHGLSTESLTAILPDGSSTEQEIYHTRL